MKFIYFDLGATMQTRIIIQSQVGEDLHEVTQYDYLKKIIQQLPKVFISMFAIPVVKEERQIEWYSTISDQPRLFTQLPDKEQAQLLPVLTARYQAIADLIKQQPDSPEKSFFLCFFENIHLASIFVLNHTPVVVIGLHNMTPVLPTLLPTTEPAPPLPYSPVLPVKRHNYAKLISWLLLLIVLLLLGAYLVWSYENKKHLFAENSPELGHMTPSVEVEQKLFDILIQEKSNLPLILATIPEPVIVPKVEPVVEVKAPEVVPVPAPKPKAKANKKKNKPVAKTEPVAKKQVKHIDPSCGCVYYTDE